MNEEERTPVAFIAEPDQVFRKTLVTACRELGLEVLQASQGIHAWKLLQKEKVDLVIADWALPEISGIALLNLVRGWDEMAGVPLVLVAMKLTKERVLEAGRTGVASAFVMPLPYEDLLAKLRRALEGDQDPRQKEARDRMQAGMALAKEGRFEAALEQFEGILGLMESAEVYFNLGYIKTSLEEYADAIEYFRRATEINQAYAKAYRMMADCFKKLGQTHQAQECYNQAANLFLENDMDEEAERLLNEALKVSPETINIYNTLGILYRKRKQFDQAIEMYRKALKVAPTNETIYYNMARTLYEMENLPKALTLLEKSLQVNPGFVHAQDLMAVIKRKLG